MTQVIPLQLEQLIHTPSERSTEYVEHYKKRKAAIESGDAITFGMTEMDRTIIPLLPGDTMGVVARPGHLKSTFCGYMVKRTAKRIVEKMRDDRCVVYVTLEQPVEEIEAYFQAGGKYTVSDFAWGRVAVDEIMRGAVGSVGLPIITIGRSLERRKRNLPKMTVDVIYDSLRMIETKFSKIPALVVIDYIQKIPLGRFAERTTEVEEAIIGVKALAVDIGAPFLIAIQAARKVDSYKVKLPQKDDCQHASAIEQELDKLLSGWRPWLTEREMRDNPKMPLSINGKDVVVKENLFVMALLKQRFEKAGYIYAAYMNPAEVKLGDLELRYPDGEFPDAPDYESTEGVYTG